MPAKTIAAAVLHTRGRNAELEARCPVSSREQLAHAVPERVLGRRHLRLESVEGRRLDEVLYGEATQLIRRLAEILPSHWRRHQGEEPAQHGELRPEPNPLRGVEGGQFGLAPAGLHGGGSLDRKLPFQPRK